MDVDLQTGAPIHIRRATESCSRNDDSESFSDLGCSAGCSPPELWLSILRSRTRTSRPLQRRAKRLRKVFRGVVLTVAGILFAAQTGGVTLLLCVAGVADIIDVLEEDAAALRLQSPVARRSRTIHRRLSAHRRRKGTPRLVTYIVSATRA